MPEIPVSLAIAGVVGLAILTCWLQYLDERRARARRRRADTDETRGAFDWPPRQTFTKRGR